MRRLRAPVFQQPITDGQGGLTLNGVELLGRMVDEIRQPEYEAGAGPVLTSPNGTRYRLGVDDAGNLTATAL